MWGMCWRRLLAAEISEITEEDTVLIIGGGPTGICTLLCVMLKKPEKILLCEQDEDRRRFIKEHYPEVIILLQSRSGKR